MMKRRSWGTILLVLFIVTYLLYIWMVSKLHLKMMERIAGCWTVEMKCQRTMNLWPENPESTK